MDNLLQFIGGKDFSSDSSSLGTGKDVIIDYGTTGRSNSNSNSCSYSDQEESDGFEEEEAEDGEEEWVEEGHYHIMEMLEEDKYFTNFGSLNFLYQFSDKIIAAYDQFSHYSPLHLKGKVPFTENELIGLEYLLDPRRERPTGEKKERDFPKIYITLQKSLNPYIKIVDELEDTFLVLRSLDYAFSHIIELALLGEGSKRLPDYLVKERVYQRNERMRQHERNICLHHQVSKEHDEKCPYRWVLYTKSNGRLMKYCTEIQSKNKYIRYTQDETFLGIMPLSFYLVNFLCGPFTEPVVDYDFWISVPVYYLDLWESGHPSVI